MAKKLMDQIAAAEQRIARDAERLKQLKKQKLLAEARAGRKSKKARQLEEREQTRRKILIGAIVQNRIAAGQLAQADLDSWLDAGLVREHDRAVFGLAPLPGQPTPPADSSAKREA